MIDDGLLQKKTRAWAVCCSEAQAWLDITAVLLYRTHTIDTSLLRGSVRIGRDKDATTAVEL